MTTPHTALVEALTNAAALLETIAHTDFRGKSGFLSDTIIGNAKARALDVANAARAALAQAEAAQPERGAYERAYNAGFVEASRLHGQEIERLRALLLRVADEPNIDKARRIADAEVYGIKPADMDKW